MKTVVLILSLGWVTLQWCRAQDPRPVGASGIQPADSLTENLSPDEATNRFLSLDQRLVELRGQYFLLGQLAEEHRKRAQDAPPGQPAKSQWENELVRELSERASGVLSQLSSASRERLTLKQTHPEAVTAASKGTAARTTPGPTPEQILFLEKLDERMASVRQEIAEALEAGNLYMIQLSTNKNYSDVDRLTAQLRQNGIDVKRLQRETADLELRRLEFRALTRE
jgi:hypothetical protein